MTSSWIADSTRFAIYHRDGFACVYCGAAKAEGAQLTLDHVIPRGRAGATNAPTNLVTCCMPCNAMRADRSVSAWVAFLQACGVPSEVVSSIPERVTAQTGAAIDRVEGRRLATAAKDPAWGFAKYIK